jgi:hypothetical protein
MSLSISALQQLDPTLFASLYPIQASAAPGVNATAPAGPASAATVDISSAGQALSKAAQDGQQGQLTGPSRGGFGPAGQYSLAMVKNRSKAHHHGGGHRIAVNSQPMGSGSSSQPLPQILADYLQQLQAGLLADGSSDS